MRRASGSVVEARASPRAFRPPVCAARCASSLAGSPRARPPLPFPRGQPRVFGRLLRRLHLLARLLEELIEPFPAAERSRARTGTHTCAILRPPLLVFLSLRCP